MIKNANRIGNNSKMIKNANRIGNNSQRTTLKMIKNANRIYWKQLLTYG